MTAIGAFGTGDISLNETLWGAVATALFSGTSMATPVAARQPRADLPGLA